MEKKEFVPQGCVKSLIEQAHREEEAARRILELSAELHLTIEELDHVMTTVRKRAYISPVPTSDRITQEEFKDMANGFFHSISQKATDDSHEVQRFERRRTTMLTEKENDILNSAEDVIQKQIARLSSGAMPPSTSRCDTLQVSIATLDRIMRIKDQYSTSHSEMSDGSQSN